MWSCEGVDEEHEEKAGVDSDVVVADGADGVDVGAVVGADGRVAGRENLEVPVRGLVVFFEAVVGEEV